MRAIWTVASTIAFAMSLLTPAPALEVKVLSAGAMKEVVLAVVPEFEKATGHTVKFANDTVGGLVRKIEGGEPFDLAVLTPAALHGLVAKDKIVRGSQVNLAQVGVGVMVRAGALRPDISTVESFKQALLDAKSVAYIDPASGGSSGIYFAGLLDQLGIAEQVKAKAKLKKGGYVADLIVSGEAELGVHQISEIVPVKEVTLVGPLPAAIQNVTVYAAGLGTASQARDAADALLKMLAGPSADAVIKAKGMERSVSGQVR